MTKNIFDYKISMNNVTILKYNGSETSVTIPNYIEGLPVTIIGKYAFLNSHVESVKCPVELKIIDISAFGSSKLKNITLNHKLLLIKDGAFMNTCLKKIHSPKYVTNICDNSFENCYNLEEITFEKNYSKYGYLRIHSNAFHNCNIKKIKFPYSLVSIENDSFSYNYNLDFVSFYNKVKFIGEKAFYKTNLNSIIIPDNIVKIERNAFGECNFSNVGNIILPTKLNIVPSQLFGNIFEDTNEQILKEFHTNYLKRKLRKKKLIFYKYCKIRR